MLKGHDNSMLTRNTEHFTIWWILEQGFITCLLYLGVLDLWEQVSGNAHVDKQCKTSKQRNTHLKDVCAHLFSLSQQLPALSCCEIAGTLPVKTLSLSLDWILSSCYSFHIFFHLQIPKPICLNFNFWPNMSFKADIQGCAPVLIVSSPPTVHCTCGEDQASNWAFDSSLALKVGVKRCFRWERLEKQPRTSY